MPAKVKEIRVTITICCHRCFGDRMEEKTSPELFVSSDVEILDFHQYATVGTKVDLPLLGTKDTYTAIFGVAWSTTVCWWLSYEVLPHG